MNASVARSLNRLNLGAALLHLGQAVAVVALSVSFSLPISASFLRYDWSAGALVPASHVLFHLSLPWLVAAFFFLSSFFHLLAGTVARRRYEADLALGLNRLRWYEYALSASVMMVGISLLVGIYDLAALLMVFILVAGMNLMGLLMETRNQGAKAIDWSAYWIGCLLGLMPWVAVALSLWAGHAYGSSAPTFVYWIFGSIFVFFNCFAINMWLQYKEIGPWRDYLFGERAYVVLSLVAKSLLAWQVFAGTLRP